MSNTQVMIIRKPPEKTELRDTNHAFIGTFRSDDIDILQDKISITCPRHPEHVMQVPLHIEAVRDLT